MSDEDVGASGSSGGIIPPDVLADLLTDLLTTFTAPFLAHLLDGLEELFVRRAEFDALRAEVEELRRLVETTEPEEPQP